MLNTPIRILIVAALCVLALVGIVARESYERSAGQNVTLAMAAVDPRTLLQGHYVTVSLVETVPPGVPCPIAVREAYASWNPEDHLDHWVAIGQNGTHHSFVGSKDTRAEASAWGPIVARGEATCSRAATTDGSDALNQPTMVAGSIGIDRFYINQADAERIDRLLRQTTSEGPATVFAIVNIGRDGRARLKGLNVNGEIIELNWL